MHSIDAETPCTATIPVAYAGGVDRISDAHLQYRQTNTIAAICGEIALLSRCYPEDEKIAAWHADALLRHMRCFARVEGLEAIRLYPLFKELSLRYPASLPINECRGRALLLSIALQSNGMDDQRSVAASSDFLLSLDAAAVGGGTPLLHRLFRSPAVLRGKTLDGRDQEVVRALSRL